MVSSLNSMYASNQMLIDFSSKDSDYHHQELCTQKFIPRTITCGHLSSYGTNGTNRELNTSLKIGSSSSINVHKIIYQESHQTPWHLGRRFPNVNHHLIMKQIEKKQNIKY